MRGRFGPAAYFPDRPPTGWEVSSGVAAGALVALQFVTASVSWPELVLGFLAAAVALGPVATTSLGKRIGEWFREIGVGGRATVFVLFAVVVVLLGLSKTIPPVLLDGVFTGGLLAGFLYTVAHLAWAGEVSGWTTDGETTD
ncbi:hypothetical protein [Natrinema salsiterrestre]|uniref:Uncharacterized protein n=1 Tax=Natrinema salsiterrestre TaxID=2950540 RepID=A0A9Q4KXR9_9EURY|nr:hypothetical protein [Natrinema salsiterrestre]MDF9745493.1 hypothetical protein [Natrinema salsiterrestre]